MSQKNVGSAAKAMARRRAEVIGPKRTSEIATKAAMARWYEECRDCDGCGWVEGGKALKTQCSTCEGTGLVRRSRG